MTSLIIFVGSLSTTPRYADDDCRRERDFVSSEGISRRSYELTRDEDILSRDIVSSDDDIMRGDNGESRRADDVISVDTLDTESESDLLTSKQSNDLQSEVLFVK